MREAGRKADAHRIRDLYREAFGGMPKEAARRRAIEILKAAGGTVCLDLWGGGLSARELVAAGLSVISVDDGSLTLRIEGSRVSQMRKHRALETTAADDGYQPRWGKVAKFAARGRLCAARLLRSVVERGATNHGKRAAI